MAVVVIKDGYGGQPLDLRIYAHENGKVELWTEMVDDTKMKNHYKNLEPGVKHDPSDPNFRTEVLHYLTLDEALQVRNELNRAIKEVVGV